MSSVITVYKTPFEYGGNDILSGSYPTYLATLPHVDFQNYQHVRNGTDGAYISVGKNYDELLDYNYLHMVNDNKKDVYAFITNVVYKNNECTWLYYKVDSWATYKGQCTFKKCFVEREHSSTDNVGDNLISDNIDCGDTVVNQSTKWGNSFIYGVLTPPLPNDQTRCWNFGGVISGLQPNYRNSWSSFSEMIQGMSQEKFDSIKSGFMLPTDCSSSDSGNAFSNSNHQYSVPNNNGKVDGYTPRNKKLLTYPYKYLNLHTSSGDKQYRFEYFSSTEPKFKAIASPTDNPQVEYYPVGYNGVVNNVGEGVTVNFPSIMVATNNYDTWVAQNKTSMMLGSVAHILGNARASVINPVGAVADVGMGLLSNLQTALKMSYNPRDTKGQCGEALSTLCDDVFPTMQVVSIRQQQAKMIDDYFDMFGYPCNRLKVPNITGRPCWNYVKTRDCNIIGAIPSKNKQEIISMFNNGVTLWHSGSNFRDYSKDNSI